MISLSIAEAEGSCCTFPSGGAPSVEVVSGVAVSSPKEAGAGVSGDGRDFPPLGLDCFLDG